jgi:hypothetical protein
MKNKRVAIFGSHRLASIMNIRDKHLKSHAFFGVRISSIGIRWRLGDFPPVLEQKLQLFNYLS